MSPGPRRSRDPGRGQLATVYIAEPGWGDSVFLEDDVEGCPGRDGAAARGAAAAQ